MRRFVLQFLGSHLAATGIAFSKKVSLFVTRSFILSCCSLRSKRTLSPLSSRWPSSWTAATQRMTLCASRKNNLCLLTCPSEASASVSSSRVGTEFRNTELTIDGCTRLLHSLNTLPQATLTFLHPGRMSTETARGTSGYGLRSLSSSSRPWMSLP